ncbi:ABC transporter ATP-binding protein [Streptomyces sp. TRM64462]|uniref:ABC transporter ATP-binding protein n=1 Tax=Streptomyces sp. TRM64462 TaxID=2741726 RepID=UPI0028162235|nr:ABC transporter ATP-binding protein [Streptomyces sp. TRM64462]
MATPSDGTTGTEQHWSRALRLLWSVSPLHMTGVVVTTLLTALLPAVSVQLTTDAVQYVADAVGGRPGAADQAIGVGVVLACVALAGHLCTVGQHYVEALLQFRMANRISTDIMEKAVRLQLEHFEDATTYDRLQRANREAAYRPYQLFSDLIGVVSHTVTLVSVAAVLLSWDPWVALAVLCAPVPSVLATTFYSRMTWQVENARSADRRRTNYLQYLVTNDRTYKETRLFSLGGFFVNRYRELIGRFYQVDRSLARRQSTANALLGLFSVAASSGAVIFAISSTIETGRIGEVAGYIAAITVVQGSAQSLFSGFGELYEHNLFLGNLFSFLDIPERPLKSGDRPFPERLTNGIEFRDVSFSYPGGGPTVLRNFSLTLPAGKCVALVGQNGAGKTTLVKLLSRLYEPTSGTILIDGHPVEEYDLGQLRRHIGVIFQDFVRYEDTARANIGLARVDALDDEPGIRRAADQADASAFLDELPQGLDTQLGRWFEGGRQLSGGQWQKVALARAFLRGAPVMVLDEPTAAIDAEAEAEIFARLREIADRATTLLIAHRFSTVRVADHIVVLDQGQVLEEGTHGELMDRDGMYAKLFRLQAAGYLDDPAPRPV